MLDDANREDFVRGNRGEDDEGTDQGKDKVHVYI